MDGGALAPHGDGLTMVTIENITVEYPLDSGELHRAVENISLTIEAGEFFTLLGPSGCGKTSILRSIAGLEHPARGRIRIGETWVFDAERDIEIPTHKRDVSMVFQSYAIWPHLTVAENVAFPLEVGGVTSSERTRRVREALELVGLGAVGDRDATRLSGGQQQRVAIARGIVRRTPLVLLDEPLSNLDAKLREQMRVELRDLLKRVGVTALYVTHDQEEALSLSDRIAVMSGGRVVELGTPFELYLRPSTRLAAEFLGQADLFAIGARDAGGHQVQTELGPMRVDGADPRIVRATHLMVRPEAVRVHRSRPNGPNAFAARVTHVQFAGRHVAYTVRTAAGRTLSAIALPFDAVAVGTDVFVELPVERLVGVGDTNTPITPP
jgi:iron(III) transport system ATP-binding protein